MRLFKFVLQPSEVQQQQRDYDSLAAEYNKRLSQTGVSLTASQLQQRVAKKVGRTIPLDRVYSFLRTGTAAPIASLQASQKSKRPRAFPTVGVSKAGLFYIDYGEFKKKWAGSNNGCTGFLVAVENLSNRLFVYPTKGKNTKQWLETVARFVELTRDVKVLYSDRDSVATAPRFKAHVESKYGVRWKFLRKGNKSFLAERYVRFVKTKLSQALAHAGSEGKVQKRWVDYVAAICEEYNNEKISGTSYRRGSIAVDNFEDFVRQLFRLKDVSLERFNAYAAGPFENAGWNSRIFKFDIGDRVLLANAANWKSKGGVFAKASQDGGFGDREYTVSGRQLRADREFKRLCPVYSLLEFDEREGERRLHFYENELVRRGRGSGGKDQGQGAAAAGEDYSDPRQDAAR